MARTSPDHASTSPSRKESDSIARPHRTGYRVWIYGESHWHRTLEGAERRMIRAQNWADGHIQIIDLHTGARVAGRAT